MSANDLSHQHGNPGYASPQVARAQPPEQFVYVAARYEGTGIDRPDFTAWGSGRSPSSSASV
jgi:56kDa selenium binding protein (SBP56)